MSSTIHMLDEINKEHGKELIGYLIKQASIEERISYPAVYDVLTHEGFFSVPEDNSKVENEKISFNNLCKRLKGECDRRKFLEKIAKEIQEKYDENINSYFKNILINENDSEYSYIESFFFAVLCVANEYDFIMEEDNMLLNSEKNSDAVVDLEWTHLWYEKTFFIRFF